MTQKHPFLSLFQPFNLFDYSNNLDRFNSIWESSSFL